MSKLLDKLRWRQRMSRNSLFQSNAGVYSCGSCGKLTRGSGSDAADAAGCHLCGRCYTEAGLENEVSDGNMTQEEADETLAKYDETYK